MKGDTLDLLAQSGALTQIGRDIADIRQRLRDEAYQRAQTPEHFWQGKGADSVLTKLLTRYRNAIGENKKLQSEEENEDG